MAIYGHMTGNMNNETTPTDDSDTIPSSSDFDENLKKLTETIDGTLTERFNSKNTEEPHFTLANSPTRER